MNDLKKDIEKICKNNNITHDDSLSEDFIREFKDKISWYGISWYGISRHQVLSEDFIREFKNEVDWNYMCKYQTLSGDFIREFQDKVNWGLISKYQTLSEDFIREFKDRVDWKGISTYQKLSKQFKEEFNLEIPTDCWIYKPVFFKKKYIRKHTNYQITDDYITAYKSIKSDNRSVFFPTRYKYEVGKEYTSNCDCNVNEENSFGLSAWTREGALNYYFKGKLLKVKIAIKDIGAIVRESNKIRCTRLKVLEEV
jgi:hypothetical protein